LVHLLARKVVKGETVAGIVLATAAVVVAVPVVVEQPLVVLLLCHLVLMVALQAAVMVAVQVVEVLEPLDQIQLTLQTVQQAGLVLVQPLLGLLRQVPMLLEPMRLVVVEAVVPTLVDQAGRLALRAVPLVQDQVLEVMPQQTVAAVEVVVLALMGLTLLTLVVLVDQA
jgi:hypothetical protein